MAYWTALLGLLLLLGNWLQGQGQSDTSLIDAYTPTSVLASPATVPLGTTVVLVCRVGGVASGTQLSYTWTCPNGPCDVGEGNNPNRKTYGDRMVLNVLTSRDEGMYTCLVTEGQDAVHGSSFTLSVRGGTVLSSYNRLIPNNAIIFDNGNTGDNDTNVGDILPPDNSSSVAVIDCSTDNSSQPLTWTDGAGQTVPTSTNLTVYQTTSGSSAALHIDTTDTSTFTNGRYQCDGGVARVVNIYINQEGANIAPPEVNPFQRHNSTATIALTQATAARSDRYISSLERTDLGVPLEVEFEETQSSGNLSDVIVQNVSVTGAEYEILVWSVTNTSFSRGPLREIRTTLVFETAPSIPRMLSVTRILSDGFELNWLPPREPNGRPQYEIEYGTDDTNFTTVDTGSRDTYYNLTGLLQNTTYYIRVVAVNNVTFDGVPVRGNESNTVVVKIAPQPPTTTSTAIPGLLLIVILAGAAAFLLLLIALLVLVTVCCTSQRRRRKRLKKKKKSQSYDYAIPPGYSNPADEEDKEGYAVIGKNSTKKHNYAYIMHNEASDKDANERQSKSIVVESSTEGQVHSEHAYYNTVNGSEVIQNKHTADEAAEEMRGMQQPHMYSNVGEKGSSTEYAAIVPVSHSATRIPRPPSQDYATIPDKEPVEGLYDTADIVPPQEEEDTLATPPAADYASIVEPAQEGADDTEQPPPVPAFDPEILYTQPDKTSRANDGVYDNVPGAPGPAAVEDYESMNAIHQSPHQALRISQVAETLQVVATDPEGLYTLPSKAEKTTCGTQRGTDGDYRAVDGVPAGQWGQGHTPAQDGQHGYAIPGRSKKRKKQAHDMDMSPEVPEYQPIVTSHKQGSTK